MLTIKSGAPFRVEHNHTTVDAPETVHHIREVFEGLEAQGVTSKVNKPKTSMWELIVEKGIPPLRHVRYCCEYLKERKFDNQHLLIGVRWAESHRRKGRGVHEAMHKDISKRKLMFDDNEETRRALEICTGKNRIATNPIIDWTDSEVWEYAKRENIKMNPLYNCDFRRVGCIGCPMASKAVHKEFARYPKYKNAYIRAFDKMILKLDEKSVQRNEVWKDGNGVFRWWTERNYDPNQMELWEDMT